MEQGSIPFVFDNRCNVLWNMGEQKKRETAIFLKRQISKLEESIGKPNCAKTWMMVFGHNESECVIA